MAKTEKIAFYDIKPVLSYDATYTMIIGERSNGKTYSVQEIMLREYLEQGKQGAIIRRWEADFRGKNGQQTFDHLVCNADGENVVKKLSNGKYDRIRYFSRRWYLAKYDAELDRVVSSEEPFCFAFALTLTEHDKSTSYPNVTTILFDEFITRDYYLPDEFVLFMNMISTIVRYRSDVRIFMLGNTVNRYCPYFSEMGLTGVLKQKRGTIEEYRYKSNEELTVAVEYCGEAKSKKAKRGSAKYFGFDNPKLRMITTGEWEIGMYPHLPMKYEKSDVKFMYYLIFGEDTLACEVICKNDVWFTFIHRWTTGIRNPDTDIVYHTDYDPRPNWKRKLTNPHNEVERFISWFFANDKVYYVDNEVGDIVYNYLKWCVTDNRK